MRRASIKTAILIPVIVILVLGIAGEIFTLGNLSSQTASSLSDQITSQAVSRYAAEFNSIGAVSFGIAKAAAPVVASYMNDPSGRGKIVELMRKILEENEDLMGIWTCWEPNAFDNGDRAYAGLLSHDETGRFIPYVFRNEKGIQTSALVDYDDPTAGDYYQGCKSRGRIYVTDIYTYMVGGSEKLLYSISIPVFKDGAFVGAVGVDIDMEKADAAMNEAKILEDGYIFTISPGGQIATHPNPETRLSNYNDTWLKKHDAALGELYAQEGKRLSLQDYSGEINKDIYFLAESVAIADTYENWIICSVVPQDTVAKPAVRIITVTVVAGVLLIVFVTLTIFLIVRRNLKALPAITAVAEQMAEGKAAAADLLGGDDGGAQTRNEISLLSRAFSNMSRNTGEQVAALQRIADGDLTVQVKPRSREDLLNVAMEDMLSGNTKMFRSILQAAEVVSGGAAQLADGSSVLSQASMEQSASLEELTSAMQAIANKAKENEEIAIKAADLSESIMAVADKGSHQMENMVHAVEEINEASQGIGKVMKVIDDIAFQTNILALNAAVEAARAGQHGKGFAVVADEVRNLAAKSAEAARDTGSLIANSIEKAKLGASIAQETNEILSEIVERIGESSRIVGEIPPSAREQGAAIKQFHSGIEQVAATTQTNSATAQESAATSQELNSQAELLRQMVGRFRLP